jgi:ABC-type transport system involved in cytochrome c biogenesis permease component
MIPYMLVAELVAVPLVALLFQVPLLEHAGALALLLGLGTVGQAAVGSLFAAMLVRARAREVLLGIVLYPVTLPVLIAGTRGTQALLGEPADLATAWFWARLLLVFDVVFITLSLWVYEPLMTAD